MKQLNKMNATYIEQDIEQVKRWAFYIESAIEQFAELLEKERIEQLHKNNVACQANINNAKTFIRPGKKYTKVDVGGSGAYMVANETGEIFGIKAYGVIHRGHKYGTLNTINEWYWGNYKPIPKQHQPGNIICKMTDLQEQKEIAALVAAAPELLEACKAVIYDWHEDDNNFYKGEPEYLKLCRAAISAAEKE